MCEEQNARDDSPDSENKIHSGTILHYRDSDCLKFRRRTLKMNSTQNTSLK